jgi:hypothetical protein
MHSGESVYRPHFASGSVWEETRAAASTQFVHDWLNRDGVADQPAQARPRPSMIGHSLHRRRRISSPQGSNELNVIDVTGLVVVNAFVVGFRGFITSRGSIPSYPAPAARHHRKRGPQIVRSQEEHDRDSILWQLWTGHHTGTLHNDTRCPR